MHDIVNGVERLHFAPLGQQCEQACTAPKSWNHMCRLPKSHTKQHPHVCGCGHTWLHPTEPDISAVRTVPGELAL